MNKSLLYYIKKIPEYTGLRVLYFFAPILPDKFYLAILFRINMGYWMSFKHPKTFSEKIQWLKLYNRCEEYTKMVDKNAVKDYVSSIIGKEYIIPTLGIWDRPEDIDWNQLPNQFVLKTTHSGGSTGVIICRDKTQFDTTLAISKLKKSLKTNTFLETREWPYKNVPRRILAEKYMESKEPSAEINDLLDYKVFCFNGEPKVIQIDYNRFHGHLRNLYTINWERINATIGYPTDMNRDFKKPRVLEEMLTVSRKLSKGIPHVRIDMYIIDDKIYFGEMTFYHGSGYEKTSPKEFNLELGDWLVLPKTVIRNK